MELVHHGFHAIVLDNLVEVFFVLVSVVDGECNSVPAESACSSDSVKVSLWVTLNSASFFLLGNVIIDHKFDFGHVNSSCDEIGGNEYINLLFSKLFNCRISFLLGHFREHDV